MKKLALKVLILFLLIIPINVDALIWLNGNSLPGNINISASILIPFPLINLFITESQETDLFGIIQMTISGHDDINKYNTLQISTGYEAPSEISVPYGSFGLNYLLLPDSWPPWGVDLSEIYVYLSVASDHVVSNIKSNIDRSVSIERDQLLSLLKLLLPELNLDSEIGEGPFEISFSLIGNISGTATPSNPNLSGEIQYNLTLPENLVVIENPLFEIPTEFEGTLSLTATFNWDKWNFFFPFASGNISVTLITEGKELPISSIPFELLPGGTFILWLDTV